MSRSHRRIDPKKQLVHLEKRHEHLKHQVSQYESRLSLTNIEQMDLQRLKKKKLATKDAIFQLSH